MARTLPLFSGILLVLTATAQTLSPVAFDLPKDSRNDAPALVAAPDGGLWLAWSSFQNGRFRLAVCGWRDGKFEDIAYPFAAQDEQLQPQWAAGVGGEGCLVYTSLADKRASVALLRRGKAGWEPPVLLGEGAHPSAVVAAGKLWVVWEHHDTLRLLTLDAAASTGTPSAPRELQPESDMPASTEPQLAAGPDGAVWLAWQASRPGYGSVRLMRLDGGNHPVAVVDAGTELNRNPRLSVDRQGRVWIVYEALHDGDDAWRIAPTELGGPIYRLNRGFNVEKPSRTVVVLDGGRWWKPATPDAPAWGLLPNVYCAGSGEVWLLSRRFETFFPLCEGLGPDSWQNFRGAWGEERCHYKTLLPMAETPDGRVWTAWMQDHRARLGVLDTPSWSILDGTDTLMLAALPRLARSGAPTLAAWDKPAPASPEAPPLPRYRTSYRGETLNVYFGDLHQHSELSRCGRWNGALWQNQPYSRNYYGLDFMCTIDHAEHLTLKDWHTMETVADMNNRPGRFVAFTGFEWTSEFDAGGNLYRGHYNAIFRDTGIGSRPFSASDPRSNTPGKLWAALRESVGGLQNVLTFGHHPSRRGAWLSWNYYDPEMAPLIEIAQVRGSYEYEGAYSEQPHSGDTVRVRRHYIADGLARGMRWGVIAGSDHFGRQLCAVYAPSLDRDAVFAGLSAKRAYATNGERIFVDARVNGHFMGEEFTCEGPREIVVAATGTTPLLHIDLFRNGHVVHEWNFPRRPADCRLRWTDAEPLSARENYYYARVRQEGGGLAWTSPIWVLYPREPGEFRFQVGGGELHVVYPDQPADFAVLMHNSTDRTVAGRVFLEAPEGWRVEEQEGVQAQCAPGGWECAVLHATAPALRVGSLSLPELVVRFQPADGPALRSPLFVIASPTRITPEERATLMDARTEVSVERYAEYLRAWEKTRGAD